MDPNTRFDAASVKPVDDASGPLLMRTTPGRFESSLAVGMVLRQALQNRTQQIVGVPSWIDREPYAITAKVKRASRRRR